MSEGARLVNANLGVFILYTLTYIGINLVASMTYLAPLIIQGPLIAGYFAAALKAMRGEKVEFADFWVHWKTGAVYVYGIVISILVFIGVICCLLPGIYLGVAWSVGMLLLIEYQMDFWPAAELSRKSVTRGWFMMFLFILVVKIICVLGSVITCGLGFFWFMPWYHCALASIYRRNFPGPSVQQTPGAGGMGGGGAPAGYAAWSASQPSGMPPPAQPPAAPSGWQPPRQ